MKKLKRLKRSMEAAEKNRGRAKLADWLLTQPGSTRRGIARGVFIIPPYVFK